jgi:uncharacterized 2Fe-2S/4Fe-4S cluster protein (DUF4445 family)
MSNTVAVTFVTQTAGTAGAAEPRTVRCAIGSSILEAAQKAGVDIRATCGARGRCCSCRVKVLGGELSPPTVQDTIQLGHEEVHERFRLGCQTRLVADCTVMSMPPRAELGHQILASETNLPDDARFVLDSGVRKHVVDAKTPTGEHHQTSDVEEILRMLPAGIEPQLPLEILRKVPGALRSKKGRLTITTFNGRVIDVEAGDAADHCYGMAFDIGTTSIVGTLMNLATGEQLASVGSLNPQAVFGGDLMSRIAYAQFNEQKLTTLRAKVINAINDFIKQACQEVSVSAHHVYKIVVVGNTCMHHIFLGIDVTYVGLAPYSPVVRNQLVYEAKDIPLKAAPNARVCLLPIVAGFVGADTMACVLATRIYDSKEIRALVDIGTNGEVVMGSRDRLVACSVPAGPALEGAQIRHGMRGAVGAIERVSIDDDVACDVIGAAPAIGICGSGLIDACAKMLDANVVDFNGLLTRENASNALPEALRTRFIVGEAGREFVLVWKKDAGTGQDITLTQDDIRQLQLAKSAIYSGIVMLQKVMDVSDEKLVELMLCGGFGNYINTGSAVRIRLLPVLPLEKITYMGNAAALGAQMALLSETERMRAFELAQRIEHVALAARPDFQDIFVDGMQFGRALADDEKAKPAAGAIAADTTSPEALIADGGK